MSFLRALDTTELAITALAIHVVVLAHAVFTDVLCARVVVATIRIATAFLAAIEAAQVVILAATEVANPQRHVAGARLTRIGARAIVAVVALLRLVTAHGCAHLAHRAQVRLGSIGALALDTGVQRAADLVVAVVARATLAAGCRRSSEIWATLIVIAAQWSLLAGPRVASVDGAGVAVVALGIGATLSAAKFWAAHGALGTTAMRAQATVAGIERAIVGVVAFPRRVAGAGLTRAAIAHQ